MNSKPHILNQEQVLSIARSLSYAQSQAEINAAQQKIKKQFLVDKNITTIVNIIIAKDTHYDMKIVLALCFNLMVQQLLSRYFKIKVHGDRHKSKVHEEMRREMTYMCSKIEKIIDSNNVPTHVKPNLIYLQLRLYFRNKQQWNVLTLCAKMEYYFRKDHPTVGSAYLENILQMGYSPKQKVQLVKKAQIHLPSVAAKALTRIIKGEGVSKCKQKSGAYEDFISILNGISAILSNTYFQIQKQVAIHWSNQNIFLSLIKAVIHEVQNPYQKQFPQKAKHPLQQTESWKANLLKICKKLSDYIGHYKIVHQCKQYVQIYLQYIIYIYQNKYISSIWPKLNETHQDVIKRYQNSFQEYMGLFISCTRYKILPYYMLSSFKDQQTLLEPCQQQNPLNIQQKMHILKTYILPLYEYFSKKVSNLLTTKQQNNKNSQMNDSDSYKQNLKQLIELFQQFCSSEEIDYQSQNFVYNFPLFIQEIAENYRYIGYFFKKMIVVLLGTWETNTTYIDGTQWIKEQMLLIQELPASYDGNPNYKTQIGILLTQILYRYLVKDQHFIKNYIQKFVIKILNQKNPEETSKKGQIICKFSQYPKSLFFFTNLFYNYMDQLPLFSKKPHLRIEKWVYNDFIEEIVFELCKGNIQNIQNNQIEQESITIFNIEEIYIKILCKYIKLTKKTIKIIKFEPVYSANLAYTHSYQKTKFSQIEQPLQSFHQYQNVLPIQYYIQIYKDIIEYNSFKMEGEPIESTLSRLQKVLFKIVQYYYVDKETNALGNENKIYYQHKIFEIFSIVLCEEVYASIYGQIFQWIVDLGANSKQWLDQFEEDVIDMIIKLLRKSHIVAALDQDKLKLLWNIAYMLIGQYSWQPYQLNKIKQNQKPFSNKQIQLIYIVSTYKTPQQLTSFIYTKIVKQIGKLTESVLYKKRKLQVSRIRPYQHEQLSFLLILHQIIINNHEYFTEQIFEELIGLFWANCVFREQFPQDFTYVDGKYNLIVLLLMRFQYDKLYAILTSKGQEVAAKIYHEVLYNDRFYRVCYDVALFIVCAVDIVSFLWSPRYDLNKLEYILKNAHFAVGGCILCLDRIYQKYRLSKEQKLQIEIFKQRLKDPVLTMDLQMQKMVEYLTNGQPYIDQFQYFRKFYTKLKNNQTVYAWFVKAMDAYIKSQVYIDSYHNIFPVHKIRRKDGMVIYRAFKAIRQQY